MVARLLPTGFAEAPKRPVQTPQREWLRGELRDWVETCLSDPSITQSGWFDQNRLRHAWERFLIGETGNSFHVWQWISVVLNQRFMNSLRSISSDKRSPLSLTSKRSLLAH
jgi:asparagine synthase (glutamine-hydrolysing)